MRSLNAVCLGLLLLAVSCVGSERDAEESQDPPGIPDLVSFQGMGYESRVVQMGPTYFDPEVDRAWLGRLPVNVDFRPGATSVAILSHRLWTDLGATPDILGARLDVRGETRIIIGIMDPDFRPKDWAIVWIPEWSGATAHNTEPAAGSLPSPGGRYEKPQ